MPDYKDELNIVTYTNQDSRIKFNKIWLSKAFSIAKLRTNLSEFQQIRLVPSPCGLKVEIVYNIEAQEVPSIKDINSTNSAGVDLGIKNIATIASDSHSCVFNGRGLLSINQFYHKKAGELRSVYEKNGIKTGTKLNKLDQKHANKVKDYLHKTSRNIVNWAVERGVKCLFIGRNVDWKQKANIGRRNNQNFCSIPHWKLIEMVTYKAREAGVRVELVQESHTSKCSFLDNESIGHHEKYVGRRVKRGLFKASDGRLINADVNGALNIMKRGLGLEDSFDVSSGVFRTTRMNADKHQNATRKGNRVGRGSVALSFGSTREKHFRVCLNLIKFFVRNISPYVEHSHDKLEGYTRQSVSHGAGEYSRDGVTTNRIESVWACTKRAILGIWHHVNVHHLQRYIDEVCFRLSEGHVERHLTERMDSMLEGVLATDHITFEEMRDPANKGIGRLFA